MDLKLAYPNRSSLTVRALMVAVQVAATLLVSTGLPSPVLLARMLGVNPPCAECV